jgi:hypothetical protein
MMPRVSVIIPTYNRAHLIREAVSSVLKQIFTNFELIVVDDGSTDNTEEVLLAIDDSRLKFLRRAHTGPSRTRNAGIQAATGEFIAFLDSDDLFLPRRLSLQVAKMENEPEAGLVYGRYLSGVGSEATLIPVGECLPRLGIQRLLLGPAFHWSTVLIRREILEKVGGFDESFVRGEDWELTHRMALAGCRMVCVPEAVAFVRKQPVSNMRDEYQHEEMLKAVLDKTFRDPRMPAEAKKSRARAYAVQLIRIACTAFLASQPSMGKEMLIRALNMDPTLKGKNMETLTSTLVYLIKGLSIDDPESTLQRVISYLPQEDGFSKKLRQNLLGKFNLVMTFQTYQEGRINQCREYAIKAIVYTPSSLLNRGLLSILTRSLLGIQSFEGIKSIVAK